MSTTASGCVQPAPGTGLVAVDGRTFPLREAAIRARAEGGLAQTTFTQRYVNPYPEPLEVLYTLPLPADGAVVGYTIALGETIITGEIEPREDARKSYLKAIEEGRAAGLLEQDRADTFTQSLGSLPPGAEVRVEIEVLHPLGFLAATAERGPQWVYRFPTVVGVRYEGAPGRVPDAERLDVDRADAAGTPVRLALDLLLADGEPAGLAPESPSHALRVAPDGGCARLALAEPAPLDRDVVVRWNAGANRIGLRLLRGGGLAGDDGRYGLLTITPPTQVDRAFARDLTILIDASGSMSGKPIERAKELAVRLLEGLGANDRFEMLAFANEPRTLVGGPVAATEKNVREATRRLARLEAGGGTEMASAVEEALSPLRADSQRQVVLLTDGYIGFESEVIGKVRRDLPVGARLHAVGIGQAPNRTLIRGAARAGRGIELILAEARGIDATAERLQKATVAPILTDVAILGRGVRAVAPERPRDVLAGQPLVVALELMPSGGAVEVTGRLAGQEELWSARIENWAETGAESAVESPLPIGALFGREAIEDQEMLLAATESGTQDVLGRIEALGLRHRITSRRTSLVAVAENPTVDPTDPRRRQRLTVELPADVSAEGVVVNQFLGMAVTGLDQSERVLAKSATGLEMRTMRRFSAMDGALTRLKISPKSVTARVLRCEHDLLVLEFEVPTAGFKLPAPAKEVFAISVSVPILVEARVDPLLSTHPGPHAPGLTLRLALRTLDGKAWPQGAAHMTWRFRHSPLIEFSVP